MLSKAIKRSKTLSDFLDLLFPQLCASCNRRLVAGEKHVCVSCINDIPQTNDYKIKDNKLETFFAGRFPFVRMASFAYFVKEGSIQSIVHCLKYKNMPDVGRFMGQLSATSTSDACFWDDIDYLVPVPLHPKRQAERGYNQSLMIAEGIYSVTNIPICTTNLLRVVNNASQTKKSRLERWSNTDGIFNITDPNRYSAKHILLIDDIITTGSTLESCAKTILESNPDARISVFCVGSAI